MSDWSTRASRRSLLVIHGRGIHFKYLLKSWTYIILFLPIPCLQSETNSTPTKNMLSGDIEPDKVACTALYISSFICPCTSSVKTNRAVVVICTMVQSSWHECLLYVQCRVIYWKGCMNGGSIDHESIYPRSGGPQRSRMIGCWRSHAKRVNEFGHDSLYIYVQASN